MKTQRPVSIKERWVIAVAGKVDNFVCFNFTSLQHSLLIPPRFPSDKDFELEKVYVLVPKFASRFQRGVPFLV